MKKESRVFDDVVIVTFLIGLFVPLALTNNRAKSLIENRKLAPLPAWKWNQETFATFPQNFQEFFNDHFGFRDQLAQAYYLSGVLLGSSSSPNVLIGKEGWLFLIDPARGNLLEDYRKNDPLTPNELLEWKNDIEAKYAYLSQQGIHYLFIIAPDKYSIYGEYFPSRIRPVGMQSRVDQFIEYMKDSAVPILDLRTALIQAKNEGQLYHHADTHWNDFGAAVAQYHIMQHLAGIFPQMTPIRYSAKDFLWSRRGGDFLSNTTGANNDLAKMLNLASILREPNNPVLQIPLVECEKRMIGEKNPKLATWMQSFMTICPSSGPSALIFRDSFFISLWPYMSPYFSKSVYIRQDNPDITMLQPLIAQHAPNIVIEEIVGRRLAIIRRGRGLSVQ